MLNFVRESSAMRVVVRLLLLAPLTSALVAPRVAVAARRPPLRSRAVVAQGFDIAAQQFDLLSLRTFRRDTILQYDATNQSEPLRIALTLLGVLFSLSIPALAGELRVSDELTLNVAAVLGTGISGGLFARNRGARQARMEKIDREYAMGDLGATYRGVRTSRLQELRGKRRVVVITGSTAAVEKALVEARVYRRRLSEAEAVVVPVFADAGAGGAASGALMSEAESKWLWAAAEPQQWQTYFGELLSARGLSATANGAWIGLNLRGRTFGSALGAPRWDEVLGTALQPSGDGFGEYLEAPYDAKVAVAEAASAAQALAGAAAAADADAEADAASLLDAQRRFYDVLTSADAETMAALWDAGATTDSYVSDVVRAGSRVEPWAAGSNAFPPKGMRATDPDALVIGANEGWTTAVERPAEGGTLLATQEWRRDAPGDAWRITAHRYIPWSADGATAVAALRCDRRGCVLIGREINTRAK